MNESTIKARLVFLIEFFVSQNISKCELGGVFAQTVTNKGIWCATLEAIEVCILKTTKS